MSSRTDVVIIGAGILGLAHAVAAVKRGLSVVILERHERAVGASIRNFGMIWPVGQEAGPNRDRALRSRNLWLELAGEAGFWCDPCGSLHVAHHEDEWAVLNEFHNSDGAALSLELTSPEEARQHCPALRPEGLKGGLFSPHELAVDPREAVAMIPTWLQKTANVQIHWSEPVVRIERNTVMTSRGAQYEAELIFVCTGADFESLYPEAVASVPLTRCKLQMMRTQPQPQGWSWGPHIAGGLTLRHYACFAKCPSLQAVRERVTRENPEYDRFGIHVMASCNGQGELVVGDSHEYDDARSPFDSDRIHALIWEYFTQLLNVPLPDPADRWNGVYLKRTDGETSLVVDPEPGVRIVNAVGGAGMTLSMGLAEEQFSGA